MKTVIIFLLIVFTFSFTDIYSQSDSSKKFMWSVSANANYKHYDFNKWDYNYYYKWPDTSNYVYITAKTKPTFSTNESLNLYFRLHKRLYLKTGLLYFNKRTIYTFNVDSFDTKIPDSSKWMFNKKETFNNNSFDIPILLNYRYKKFYIECGMIFRLFDFYYGKFRTYEGKYIVAHEAFFPFKYNNYRYSDLFYFNGEIGYIIYNKPFPIYLSAGFFRPNGYSIINSGYFFSLGINAFIGKR